MRAKRLFNARAIFYVGFIDDSGAKAILKEFENLVQSKNRQTCTLGAMNDSSNSAQKNQLSVVPSSFGASASSCVNAAGERLKT